MMRFSLPLQTGFTLQWYITSDATRTPQGGYEMSDFTQRPFAGRPPQYAHDDINPYPHEMRVGSHEEQPGRRNDARQSHEERRWHQGNQAPGEPEGFYPYEVAEGYEPQGQRTSPSVGQYDPYRDEFRPMVGGESAGSIEGGGPLRGPDAHGSPPRYPEEAPYRQQSRSPESGAGRWTQWAKRAPQHRTFGKCPRNYQRSEARICEDISERIMREPAIDASNVEIDVHGQEVTLKGSVPDRWMKRCIDEFAHDAMMVDHVENRIRVQPDSASEGAQRQEGGDGSRASSPHRRDDR